MKGFSYIKKGYLEKVENESTALSLLGHGDGVEVMSQTVPKGKEIELFPAENSNAIEFFYIINGQLEGEVEGNKLLLGQNESFTVQNLSGSLHFTVKEDVVLLIVTTEPSFYLLSEEIKELRDIGRQVEEKDRYTFNHSARVADYAVKTGRNLKLQKEQMKQLFLASILHDIGKINVPEEILNKPGKLTKEEFSMIKKHPQDGADLVRKTAYSELASVIEQHHERLDGSGYPYGLKDAEITLGAKIIGVCDTYDAMTEDRSYRKAFPVEEALAEIRRLSGTQFDPEVVEAFLQVIQEEKR